MVKQSLFYPQLDAFRYVCSIKNDKIVTFAYLTSTLIINFTFTLEHSRKILTPKSEN